MHKNFKFHNFCWSFSSNVVAVKGLRPMSLIQSLNTYSLKQNEAQNGCVESTLKGVN